MADPDLSLDGTADRRPEYGSTLKLSRAVLMRRPWPAVTLHARAPAQSTREVTLTKETNGTV